MCTCAYAHACMHSHACTRMHIDVCLVACMYVHFTQVRLHFMHESNKFNHEVMSLHETSSLLAIHSMLPPTCGLVEEQVVTIAKEPCRCSTEPDESQEEGTHDGKTYPSHLGSCSVASLVSGLFLGNSYKRTRLSFRT